MKLVRALLLAVLCCAAAWAQTPPVVTVVPSPATYSGTGGTVRFEVTVTYSEAAATIRALGITIGAPAGWSFAGVEGPSRPNLFPVEGASASFDFAYTSFPNSPLRFSFSVTYPAGLVGSQVFRKSEGANFLTFRGDSTYQVTIPDIVIAPATSGGGGGGTTVVAPTITSQPTAQTVNEGQSVIWSVTAAGTAPLTYQWRKDGNPLAGATQATLTLPSVPVSAAGTYTVVVSNSAGSITSAAATLVVKSLAQAPQIVTQPRSGVAVVGTSLTLSVDATGTGPLTYQWRKDGVPLVGATSATLTLAGQAGDAGSYTLLVTNSAGAVLSSAATVTVSATPLPVTIVTQPVAQAAALGGAATFRVSATGSGTVTYQWQKDGVPLAGATTDTLNLTGLTAATAGTYRVVVTNGAGSVTSNSAALVVSTRGIAGIYFGAFGGNAGALALLVRADRTGVLLGFANGARVALISRELLIDTTGRFSLTLPDPRLPAGARGTGTPPVAAHEGDFHVEGAIAADGALAGTVSGLNLSFSAPAVTGSGATTTAVAGFYQAGAIGGSAQSYTLISPAGQALVVTLNGPTADGGVGSVTANGVLSATTAASATITGAILADSGTLTATVTPSAGPVLTFSGANNDARLDVEKLINISTRSQTGTTANTLIAGFVISGDAPKPVLVRAIGPTLGSAFGVAGALSASRLELFRGTTSLAVGNDWAATVADAPSAATIAATTSRVGAFGLPANSRDAALLLTLEPGAYTAVVTGQGGASGVCLVEVYDATIGAIPRSQRIINIATRATAGTGDNALIAGFYVSGSVPKRLLIRGVGPALAQFGVGGVLARPQLSVSAGATVLAQNAGWSSSADATTIASSSAQVGAFALAAGSQDAALIVHLPPGAYTAQVSGVANTTGVALVEVYELP